MNRYVLSIFFSFLILTASAQTTPPLNLPKDAKVEGSVVSMRTKKPLNNELIVFKSQKNGNEFQALSDTNGKFSTRLPAGDKYSFFIMGFKDSTSNDVLDIPALGPNSFYKNSFTVNIEFDASKTFILENVEFDFGKATLRAGSYTALDNLVDYLERNPGDKIELGGYTDNIGSAAKNKALSLERAKSIVAYLISKGIAEERLAAKGYGADDPIEENTTEAGRQKNRRTEVKIL
jgi:outer membrane protein OmpA-like peptidoglycan-associated protein